MSTKTAEELLEAGEVGRGLEVLLPALRAHGVRCPRTQHGAVASLAWQRLCLRLRGLSWTERAAEHVSREVLDRLDAYQAAVRAFSMVDTVRSAELQARGLRLALRSGEPVRAAVALLYEVPHLAAAGGRGVTRARQLLHAARAATERCGSPRLDGLLLATHGMLSLYGGDLPDARERLGRADDALRDEPTALPSELSRVRLHRLFTARYTGELGDLSRWLERYLDDAVRAGDRYSETTMSRGNSVAWLAEDDPGQVRRRLDEAAWSAPAGAFHHQHWWELWARTELALYEGDAARALTDALPGFRALSRSLLARAVQLTRIESYWLWGRIALACAHAGQRAEQSLAEARRSARRLARERFGYATVWAQLLRAGVAALAGGEGAAVDLLGPAITVAEREGLLLCAAASRRRLGELVGGEAGARHVAEADRWMAGQSIRDPARMTAMMAPGF